MPEMALLYNISITWELLSLMTNKYASKARKVEEGIYSTTR